MYMTGNKVTVVAQDDNNSIQQPKDHKKLKNRKPKTVIIFTCNFAHFKYILKKVNCFKKIVEKSIFRARIEIES